MLHSSGSFFLANITKIKEGGYVPLLLALAVYAVMYIWHRGISAITERVEERPIPIEKFMAELAAKGIARPPGTAIFLTRTLKHTPPVWPGMWIMRRLCSRAWLPSR
jgi:KUP system potassium uptake protein